MTRGNSTLLLIRFIFRFRIYPFTQSIKRVSTARTTQQLKNANTRTVRLISFNVGPQCARDGMAALPRELLTTPCCEPFHSSVHTPRKRLRSRNRARVCVCVCVCVWDIKHVPLQRGIFFASGKWAFPEKARVTHITYKCEY